MLYIFNCPREGVPVADDVLAQAIARDIGPVEFDRTVYERQDGRYRLDLEPLDAPGEPPRYREGRRAKESGARKVRFSPAFTGLTLADFPAEWNFGNGISCAARVRIMGEICLLSWVVLTPAAAAVVEADPAKYELLRTLMEGG